MTAVCDQAWRHWALCGQEYLTYNYAHIAPCAAHDEQRHRNWRSRIKPLPQLRRGSCPGPGILRHLRERRTAEHITLHEIGHDLAHAIVHVDRSALSLVRQLLTRPGIVAREYISGKRKKYFGPFAFLVVVVALGSGIIALSGFPVVTADQPNAVAAFLQSHANLAYFIQVPILAAWCRIICAYDRLNFAEHLVVASYTSGMHVLWFSLVAVPVWYLSAPGPELARYLFYANLPIWPVYFGFAASQFLPGRRPVSALQGVLATLMTWGTTQGLATAISSV